MSVGGLAGEELRAVALDQIRFDPTQPRVVIDELELAVLRDSMRAIGRSVQHITVRAQSDGTYLLVSGERRVRAAQLLGWDSLPAVVTSHSDDDVRRLEAQIAENAARSPLTPTELCDAIGRLHAAGVSPAMMAGTTGLSLRTVYNYLAILDHEDLVRDLAGGRSLRAVLVELRRRSDAPARPVARRVATLNQYIDELEAAWDRLPPGVQRALAARLEGLAGRATLQTDGLTVVDARP